MVVLYKLNDNVYLSSFKYNVDDGLLTEQDDKLFFGDRVIVNDLTKIGWGYYEYKLIVRQYNLSDDDLSIPEEIPQTISGLNLIQVSVDDATFNVRAELLGLISTVSGISVRLSQIEML